MGGDWGWASSAGRGGRAVGILSSCIVLVGGSGCEGLGEEMRRGIEESTWRSGEVGVVGLTAWAAVSFEFISIYGHKEGTV